MLARSAVTSVLTVASIALTACSRAGTVPTQISASQSGGSSVAALAAAPAFSGTYEGPGYDNLLGDAVYAMELSHGGKDGILTFTNAEKLDVQVYLLVHIGKRHYVAKAYAKCTGTVKGDISPKSITGVYGQLDCDGEVHSGHFEGTKTD